MKEPQLGFMGQLTTKDVIEDINFAVENGFDWFEIALDWKQNFNLSDKVTNKIKRKSKEHSLKLIVHTAFYLPTSTLLPEIRKGVYNNIEKACNLAKKVGSNRLNNHPRQREMPDPAIELTYQSLVHNLKKAVEIGEKKEVKICLENFDDMGDNLCTDFKDYYKVLNSVKGLKATLDIGHANTSDKGPAYYLSKLKDKILDIHVHDNKGDKDEHRCIKEGNIDFEEFLKKCKELNYTSPFILELFPFENIMKGKKRFEKIWKKV